MTCLYCPSNGPYTLEHVIPAGMGGDDAGWLLRDLVCADCNTKVFSPLETKLMRASPVAVARLFLQTKTRNGTPSIDTPFTYFDDVERGLMIEQEFRAGGTPFVLPQILFLSPEELSLTASDGDGVKSLLQAVDGLGQEVVIVEKAREGSEIRYYATALSWQNSEYQPGARTSHSKAPRDAVFLEPLAVPEIETASVLKPRIFQRTRGGLTCRAADVRETAQLLTLIRLNRAALTVPHDVEFQTTEHPMSHIHHLFDITAIDRACTKIAVNLCAHLFGADAVRGPAFANAREYARFGTAKVRRVRTDIMECFMKQFPPLPHHHLLIVHEAPADDEAHGCIMVALRLYGVVISMMAIAEGPNPLPSCPQAEFVVVDYLADRIDRMSHDQFASLASGQLAS